MTKKRNKGAAFFGRRIKGKTRIDSKRLEKERIGAEAHAILFSEYSMGLLETLKKRKFTGKVIFLGQGMRPLYETIKKLNHALKFVPRERIRYFIYSSEQRGKPHYKTGEASAALIQAGIVDAKTRDYFVVDFDAVGHVARFKKELGIAVKKASGNEKASVRVGVHTEGGEPTAVNFSEGVNRPVRTRKTLNKGITRVEPFEDAPKGNAKASYLILQEAIDAQVRKTIAEYRKKK